MGQSYSFSKDMKSGHGGFRILPRCKHSQGETKNKVDFFAKTKLVMPLSEFQLIQTNKTTLCTVVVYGFDPTYVRVTLKT
jgi:hypothetical protein